MPLIFISHASANNPQALAVAQWLEDHGWVDYFLDISESQGLYPGAKWQLALKEASHRCEAVVLLVSRAWLDSKWCLAEFLLAKQLGKKIFGVIIEDIPIDDLPRELAGEFQLCNLVTGNTRVAFTVAREPYVASSHVDFPKHGLAELKRGLQNAGLAAKSFPWPPQDDPKRAPYRGLKPYEAADAAVFFGRDAAISRGLDHVRQLRDAGIDKLLIILGSSGAGKSSFMRAGLWPRLKRDDHNFCVLPVVRPGHAAIHGDEGLVNSLAAAFNELEIAGYSRGNLREQFSAKDNTGVLLTYLKHLRDKLVSRANADSPEPTLILPIDQAEELYTIDGTQESAQLREQLSCLNQPHNSELVQEPYPRLIVILTIRTDLYQHLQDDECLQSIGRRIIDLTPMDRAEYRGIIEGPAERATTAGNKLLVEPALREQLLADTQGADALPMLAFTLERLYADYGAEGHLTLDAYEQTGGVTGSLTAAIDTAMALPQNAPPIPVDKVEQHHLLKQAFVPWLAEVDDLTGEPRRRVAEWEDLPPGTQPMLVRLTEARLLIRDERSSLDGQRKHEVIEIAHEALLRRWPALADWLRADQDALKTIGSVSRAAAHWEQAHRHTEYLIHTGERLREAEALLERADFADRLKVTGRDYVANCRSVEAARIKKEQQQQALERKQQRRLGWFATAAAIFAIGASIAGGWAYQEKTRADLKTAEAVDEKQRAESARAAADVSAAIAKDNQQQTLRTLSLMHADMSQQQTESGNATVGALLALEALPKHVDHPERPYVPEAEAALRKAFDALIDQTYLLGHQGDVFSAVFSHDGTRVVTASKDKTARLWDASTGQTLQVFSGHEGWVTGAVFSHDGSRIVTASRDKTARLWDAATGQALQVFVGHQSWVLTATISHDGSRVITASRDKTARLWNVTNGQELARVNHDGEVTSAVLNRDASRILTASTDKTARLWDTTDGREIAVYRGHGATVNGAAFNPNETKIVTASDDASARVWDLASVEALAVLNHRGEVKSAEFNSAGTRILTASHDKTARIWDAENGNALATLSGHDEALTSAKFGRDGMTVVTSSWDDSARLWDVASGQQIAVFKGHNSSIWTAEMSPDDTRVVTASLDHTARIWGVPRPKQPAAIKHDGAITSAAFNSDGTRLLTASTDKTARVWDVETNKALTVLKHDHPLTHAALSPDGTRAVVLTAAKAENARLWNLESAQEIAVLNPQGGTVRTATFSRDGKRIVTTSNDEGIDHTRPGSVTNNRLNSAVVWDAVNGRRISELSGHRQLIYDAHFSADGTQVITASLDKTARVWRVTDGQELARFNHNAGVRSASFSRDGNRVLTACQDWTARLWDTATGRELAIYRGHKDAVTGASFSPDERLVVTVSKDSTARLWEANSAEELVALRHRAALTTAVFDSTGTQLITASKDRTARVWHAPSGLAFSIFKHESPVKSAMFGPNGRRAITVSGDSGVRLWDTPHTQDLIDLAYARLPRSELSAEEKARFFVSSE